MTSHKKHIDSADGETLSAEMQICIRRLVNEEMLALEKSRPKTTSNTELSSLNLVLWLVLVGITTRGIYLITDHGGWTCLGFVAAFLLLAGLVK